MNGVLETKSEIRARMDELKKLKKKIMSGRGHNIDEAVFAIDDRQEKLQKSLDLAEEDLSSSIIRSHKAICQVKQMDEKAAYGNDPAMYYTLGICGEAGEMANAIVKSQRNGADQKKILAAVMSELPDVVIYAYVLAYVLDIDLSKLVNDKVEVVIQRANDGYYGKPMVKL